MTFTPALEVTEWPTPTPVTGLDKYRASVHWSERAPILIDNVSRFRDRRRSSNVLLCGNDCYVDSQGRAAMKSPFDGDVVCGFDSMPKPYVLSLTSEMNELLFEAYRVPSVNYGLDALFAGLSWGGAMGSDFLHRLLQLKYPNLPQRITPFESQTMLEQLCYVSPDYDTELRSLSVPENLAKIDKVVQLPYVPPERQEKSQEELEKIAERKRAAGQRLIEQTRAMRQEKAEQNENDLKYYTLLKEWKDKEPLEAYLGFESEQELDKIIKRLDAAIKRFRGEEVDNEEDKKPPSFPLLDVPDAELDEEGLKEKRRQRLLKAGYDARMRARAEKAEEERLQAEAEARERQEQRDHPEQWLDKIRKQHQEVIARIQGQKRLKEMMPDRKSAAAQQRMKNITALASEQSNSSGSRQRRKRGDDEDTFGADDSDWAVYRNVVDAGEEEEREAMAQLEAVEAKLLEHDTQFTSEDTYAAMQARKTLLVTTYLRGFEPKWDPNDVAQYHQVHLNVERIRVPEVTWQPIMAGVDQAGLTELTGHVLRSFEAPVRERMIRNVLVTGRYAQLPHFDTRLAAGLRALLPPNAPLSVRRAQNARFDPWRGMRQWVLDQPDVFRATSVTRADYEEKGAGWFKEHGLSACWQP
ncbi:hypothetical protein CBS9595_000039 [Malassezia furfur]|nr:hypothetical protein CBS9595_000039 [Malassezia furfur]